MQQERKFTLWFNEIRIEDLPSVGGKNASLREGIDSISINPDSVIKITLKVLETEKALGL